MPKWRTRNAGEHQRRILSSTPDEGHPARQDIHSTWLLGS
jgi:hypothetical protein